MKTLVLGMGNDMFGDDGIGLHIVRQLRDNKGLQKSLSEKSEDVDFIECTLCGLALLDVIQGYDRLIMIDTINKEKPETGRIHVIEEFQIRHIPGPSPHYISVPQAMEIGRKIGLKMPTEIRIVAVESKNLYNLGEGLTAEMKKVIPEIVQKTTELIMQ
ncbi:MAG: hydrogenase maturation protease [Candidatus Aminicenantes bacterium]|nr:hydrogenase maturation protease [Candidatus Aminicenantes bacterium]MDH5386425.1 hydrogenase maturation protease [Candidatus Aminicenantes bacterium]MDH5744703.1 hydrogenase maturation protease [Candidatus Aminicenantes bacterium]